MKRLALTGCAAACVLASAGASPAETTNGPVRLDGVAAYVNSAVITVGDVLGRMQSVHRQLARQYEGDRLKTELGEAYVRTLDALIDRRLVLDAFEAQKGQVPEWAVDQRVAEIVHDDFKDNREDLLKTLTEARMTFDEWRTELREQLIVSSMRAEHVQRRVNVSATDVRAEYEKHRDRYESPGKVKLSIIAIRQAVVSGEAEEGQKRQKAARALARLRAGEDFAAVAVELSEDGKAAKGGQWDWIEPSMLRPELAEPARTLTVGAVSDIIEAGGQYYIVRVDERHSAGEQSFLDVQREIERSLRQKASAELYEAWTAKLRKNAYIRVIEADLFQ